MAIARQYRISHRISHPNPTNIVTFAFIVSHPPIFHSYFNFATERLSLGLNLIQLHAGQLPIWASPSRFKVLACGRRFDKTELGKRLILELAVVGAQCWWLAPTYGMAGQVWRDLKRTLKPLTPHIDSQDRRIDLPNGGGITIRSTHTPDLLRGAGLDFAVLDEAAYMPDTVWPEVVRPMLMDSHGGAAFLSTPNGFNGFWSVYQLGLDPAERERESFHAPSVANPRIDPAEIEAIRRVTSERVFRAEYLAEFLDDAFARWGLMRLRRWRSCRARGCGMSAGVTGVGWMTSRRLR